MPPEEDPVTDGYFLESSEYKFGDLFKMPKKEG